MNPTVPVVYGDACLDTIIANQVANLRYEAAKVEAEVRSDIKDSESNIRREVAKSEADIRADVLREGQDGIKATKDAECTVTAAVKDAECRLNTNMLTQFGVVREQLIRNEYESKLTGEKVIKELSAVAQHNAERTQDKAEHGFEENQEAIDDFRHFATEKFNHAREEDLEEKVDSLREKLQTAELSRLICCGCGGEDPSKK